MCQTLDAAMSSAIVSASDDNYLPLAKGLWLSLSHVPYDLVFIDFGGSGHTRAWLQATLPRVRIVSVPSELEDRVHGLALATYHRAQLLRPFLPEILPDFEFITWIDSDAWVQESRSCQLVFEALYQHPDHVVTTALLDRAYYPLFDFPRTFVHDNISPVYEAFYGAQIADEFQWRPLLPSCLFGMKRSNPIWALWALELKRLWTECAHVPANILHVAEQTAFNYLVYTSRKYIALSAVHSFLANLGRLVRNQEGVVVVDEPERRKVGVIQLNGVTEGHAQRFLEAGILFQSGEYLLGEEREHLLALSRS